MCVAWSRAIEGKLKPPALLKNSERHHFSASTCEKGSKVKPVQGKAKYLRWKTAAQWMQRYKKVMEAKWQREEDAWKQHLLREDAEPPQCEESATTQTGYPAVASLARV